MRRRLLSEQRGAISILAGLSLVFLVASAAMTVDIGQAAWRKRDLQKMVDVVSLDAVRALGDRRDPMVDHQAQALDLARRSATRNGFDYLDAASGNSLTVELGIADSATKAFTPVTSAQYASANAVRVTATHTSRNRFMPGNVPLTARAVAMVDQIATFSVGSRLVRLDSVSSPIFNRVLGQMLGSNLSLDAASYNGLADATVRLGAVWSKLGLGSPSQILSTQVQVRDLLTATASALNDQGDPASVAAAGVLGTMATQVSTTARFTFGDFLDAATGDPGDAANARLNVLDLIGTAAVLANGTNLLNLTVPITIPGVTSTTLKLGVIEPPRKKTGRVGATARTAQARMKLDLTLAQKLTVLLQQGTVRLPLYLEAAGARATLTAIRCDIPPEDGDITVHAVAEALRAWIGTVSDGALTDPSATPVVTPGELVNLTGLVRVTGSASATMPASAADLMIPWHAYRSVGSTSSVTLDDQLLASLSLNVQVLGLGVNASTVASNLLAILTPVISILDATLFEPLKEALAFLGIEVGGADVGNHDQDCGSRRLIG